jgi:hypothetical protein
MNEISSKISSFLTEAGFEVFTGSGPFTLVAQNPSTLVFVAETGHDLEGGIRSVLNSLAGPFRGKKFGPKTMEMYCIFVSDQSVPVSLIEQCEQDLRVCRKVVVTGPDQIWTQISFLRPLGDVLAASPNVNELFWAETARHLNGQEITFLKKAIDESLGADDLLPLIPIDR